jgi:hypothetical protein
MFSGGNKERPHLREMGRFLAGTLGMITGFELLVADKSQSPKLPRRITLESVGKDIDLYQHRCPDIYTGIDEIVRLYGFRGIEPNTVFMGWTGKEERRDRVEWLLRECEASHVSTVLLNYDAARGFGEYETIDIWWKGNDRNLAFAINLMRHLTSSGDWKDAGISSGPIRP